MTELCLTLSLSQHVVYLQNIKNKHLFLFALFTFSLLNGTVSIPECNALNNRTIV
jgi:hypothetical protein